MIINFLNFVDIKKFFANVTRNICLNMIKENLIISNRLGLVSKLSTKANVDFSKIWEVWVHKFSVF